MGTNLITAGILKNKSWKLLREKVSEVVSIYQNIRKTN